MRALEPTFAQVDKLEGQVGALERLTAEVAAQSRALETAFAELVSQPSGSGPQA